METHDPMKPFGQTTAAWRCSAHAPGDAHSLGRWHRLALPFLIGAVAYMVRADDAYTFETLTVNRLIDAQDQWRGQPGQGDAAVAWDASGSMTATVAIAGDTGFFGVVQP